MRLPTDDDAARVDQIFLGPRGWSLPWQARYIAYGIGGGIFMLLRIIEQRAGISFGIWSIAWTLLITVMATREIGKKIGYDTPARSIGQILWREISAARPPRNRVERAHYRTSWIFKDGT